MISNDSDYCSMAELQMIFARFSFFLYFVFIFVFANFSAFDLHFYNPGKS